MFPILLEADPGFHPVWNEFVAEWRDDPELPLYLALSDLARYLIKRLETGNTASFQAIFLVVERWHVEGDPYVREAASVGLIEGLQNTHLHRSTEPAAFLPWLGPESRRWWKKVEDFWSKGTLLRDD
jgi:hypothetical protein